MTPTPTPTIIICGSGTTTGNFYYYDCCGEFITGTTIGLLVTIDYTRPHNGVYLLDSPATTECPTPTPTPTPTLTPTLTSSPTPTPTSTSTPTPSITPTSTPTPTVSGVYILKNDCDVFTLFDMGVQCVVVNQPTTFDSLDGILSLRITGGTSPYNITWEDGQKVQTLTNIQSGSYEVIVIDYYGDYSARTICNIFAPTPTLTPTLTSTPTPTPTATYTCTQLCMSFGTTLLDFVCNGVYDGRLKWTYNSDYNIVWNGLLKRWEVTSNPGSLISTEFGSIISTSQNSVPLDSWTFAGGEGPTISVFEGPCPPVPPLTYTISKVDDQCETDNNNTGSISIFANGGVPPLSYSIYGGAVGTFQPSGIFNGLAPATYSVVIQDSTGTTLTSSVVISSTTVNQTYTVSLETEFVTNNSSPNLGNQIIQYNIDVNPPIPSGLTITVNLNVNYSVVNKGPWYDNVSGDTASFDIDPLLYKNNVNISNLYSSITEQLTESVRPECPSFLQVTTSGGYVATITMTANDNIVGILNNYLTIMNPVVDKGCTSTISSLVTISLDDVSISGCNCCTAVLSNVSITETQTVVGVV